MTTLRAKRLQPQPEPELLIRFAFYLLEQAGAAPAQFVTVAQLAAMLGVDRETIRAKIRHSAIEAYFDRRFLQYAIPLVEAERLLAARGLTIPDEFATAQSALALIPGGIMITDPKKKSEPLSPSERSRLETLLAKIGGPSVESVAKTASELSAEQSRLHKEQQRLVEQEQRLSAKLQTIRSNLDATTTELMGRARRRQANRNLVEYLEIIRTQIDAVLARSPDYARRVDPSELTTLMRALFDIEVDRTDAVRSRFQELTATPQLTEDDRARLQAEEVVRAGEKWHSGVFRDDALPPTSKRGRRQ